MSAVKIEGGSVVFDFGDSKFFVVLHRTIRLPESGQMHGLPPGHGQFPVRRVQDYQDRVPRHWLEHGGLFMPIHEREALWLGFSSNRYISHAVKVAAGKINAVNGHMWSNELTNIAQDHMVSPPQPWIDGFKDAPGGSVRQFVATALGRGATVEGQVTGKEEFGGIQIMVVPPKHVPPPPPRRRSMFTRTDRRRIASNGSAVGGGPLIGSCSLNSAPTTYDLSSEMGLGAGAEIRQVIHESNLPIDHWSQERRLRTFIHFVSPTMWEQITGERAPEPPADAHQVAQPHYSGYVPGGFQAPVVTQTPLDQVKSLGEQDAEQGVVKQDDTPIGASPYWAYYPTKTVGDGKW